MSFIYKVFPNWNTAEVLLNVIVPQPRTRGMQYDRRQYTGSNNIVNDMPYIEFQWNISVVDVYQALLLQFDLISNDYSEVTVLIQNERYQSARKNGIALLPLVGEGVERDNFFLRDVTLTVHSLRDPS